VHRKLGDAGSGKLTNLNVSAQSGGTFITVQYDTKFARGPAVESFTWIKEGNSVKLYRYNIQSNLLAVE
jgi:hypothetical protein